MSDVVLDSMGKPLKVGQKAAHIKVLGSSVYVKEVLIDEIKDSRIYFVYGEHERRTWGSSSRLIGLGE